MATSIYTDKFLAEFPDGIVPIRHIPPMRADWDTPVEYLTKLIERYDAAHQFPIEELDTLRDMYIEALSMEPIEHDLVQPILARMMELGLTLRQISLYVGQPPSAVCSDLLHGKSLGQTEEYVCADELLAEGESLRAVASATGLGKNAVESLSRLRRGLPCKNAAARAA